MEEEELLSMKEVAQRLGISRVTVWKLVRDSVLPARQNPIDKRERLIPLSAVQALERRGRRRKR
jgi:excisionase family DNA binding protein